MKNFGVYVGQGAVARAEDINPKTTGSVTRNIILPGRGEYVLETL